MRAQWRGLRTAEPGTKIAGVAPWRSRYELLASGNDGTRRTLSRMSELAREGARSPAVIRAAQDAVRHVPERDDRATMRALLEDVRRRMRYTPDPLDTELVKAPEFLVEQSDEHGAEPMDCDDAVTLLAALLAAVGIPSRFVVVAADPTRADWSHVYLHARTSGGAWVSLDPIVRGWDVGGEVPAEDRKGPRVWAPAAGCERQEASMRSGVYVNPTRAAAFGVGCPPSGVGFSLPTIAGGLVEKLRGGGDDDDDDPAPAPRRKKKIVAPAVVVQPAPAAPKFFERYDPTTGLYKTDYVKVGFVAAGALGVAYLAWRAMSAGRGR